MKAFWGSVVLFCLLIGAITVNGHYVRARTEELTAITDALLPEETRSDALKRLDSFWEENRKYLAISIKRSDLHEAEELSVLLKEALRIGEEQDFYRYRALLSEKAKEFDRTERISPESIF